MFCVNFAKTLCVQSLEKSDMQISEAAGGAPAPGAEPCRFPKLEECAHFHYERVQLPKLTITLQTNIDQSLHSQHSNNDDDTSEWFMIQATSGDECWLLQRNIENFKMLDAQLHQCIYDRKISRLPDLSNLPTTIDCFNNEEEEEQDDIQEKLKSYLERFSDIADNTINCGPILNWLQMDNKGHRLLVPSEESRSINTPAVAAAYSVRRYVSQARDELNLEVGDMISVIDMASPGESIWWRGKRGFQVGFFPQYCVHIIGDKVPRNMPLPPPVVGSLALTPIKPVLRKHGKLITFFRSFLLNRPSRRRLKQSGILRERVFGCDLGEHLLNTSNDIPMVLKYCSEFIERYGIVDGIYRLSGITSNIQKLRNTFDEERIPNLYTDDILQDIHSVASLLKMYFRELPNPLCTYQLYQSFVNAVQGCNSSGRNVVNDHERLLKMRETVQKLPPPHYRTLEYLMRHLARVAKHGHSTGMTTRNIAIVWAPNLLRSAELEIGGVAALQGVGVQAVVTEFLICYADLIFCDHLPNLSTTTSSSSSTTTTTSQSQLLTSPKKTSCRPKSLAISTPAKLITLEEARNKHLLGGQKEDNYIEVGGGPKNLPKKYHTIIELRKRPTTTTTTGTTTTKRSPLGWRSLFTKNRHTTTNNNNNNNNNSNNDNLVIEDNKNKNRKASTPAINLSEQKIVDIDLIDMKRKLRSVKSAESLTTSSTTLQQYNNNNINDNNSMKIDNEIDNLGPLFTLNNKSNGHNRSISHDSYFDTLQQQQQQQEQSQNNSLLDLSEIQLNFELEESEMRIFSEDESLVSSPRLQQQQQKRLLNLTTTNPSPKKQARIVLSPDTLLSRKRTRLEDQLSDIQYIDCTTPDNLTIALIHDDNITSNSSDTRLIDEYDGVNNDDKPPNNKSPRNSLKLYDKKRQSLNLDDNNDKKTTTTTNFIPKSLTDININRQLLDISSVITTPTTPPSVCYKQLDSSSDDVSPSTTTTTDYNNFNDKQQQQQRNYENILTTISITYKSPRKMIETPTTTSPIKQQQANLYENVVVNVERAIVPTSIASLPYQEATQPIELLSDFNDDKLSLITTTTTTTDRPKSLSALDDLTTTSSTTTLKTNDRKLNNLSSDAICDINDKISTPTTTMTTNEHLLTLSLSNQSSITNLQYTPSIVSSINYQQNFDKSCSITDLTTTTTTNDDLTNSTDTTSHGSLNFCRLSLSKCSSPRVSSGLFSDDNNDHDNDMKNLSRNSLIHDSDIDNDSSDDDDDDNNDDRHDQMNDDLIQFSPIDLPLNVNIDQPKTTEQQTSIDNNHKKSNIDDNSIYQQVKFFRRSIHEVNALLDLPLSNTSSDIIKDGATSTITTIPINNNNDDDDDNNKQNNEQIICDKIIDEQNYDSLEAANVHVYENIEISTKDNNNKSNNDDDDDNNKVCVKDLKNRFEDVANIITNSDNKSKKYINYDKDGLPPCLRARNLKYQLKTRSLDEEEFKKEFSVITTTTINNPITLINNKNNDVNDKMMIRQRCKSFDENLTTYKTNSLPKKLNPPKCLPLDEEFHQLNKIIHLSHSNTDNNKLLLLLENDDDNNKGDNLIEQQKKRERIEKYKEERRKFLHDKYRSESFKEDKDVLMSQLKLFRNKDDDYHQQHQHHYHRRKSTKFDNNDGDYYDDNDDDSSNNLIKHRNNVEQSQFNDQQQQHQRTIVELRNNRKMTDSLSQTKNINSSCSNNNNNNNSNNSGDNKEINEKIDKRRHTFENRERESDIERFKRISLENSRSPRREKPPPPTINIKDMKAIFESKSKQ